MNKIMPIALLAVGTAFLVLSVVLIVNGINHVSSSSSSDFPRLLSGAPLDKSIWLLVGGLVVMGCGFEALFRRPYRH